MNAKPKRRKCKAKGCDKMVTIYNSLQPFCSPACGYKVSQQVLEDKAKKEKLEAKIERIAIKKKFRENDRPHQVKLTQAVVNKYVVYVQEAGKPCYTCGKVFDTNKLGGLIDCGHWLTRGSRPDRARDTRQMRRQCVNCNRYNSGRPKVFEQKLIEELGQVVVDEIRGPSDGDKITCQDLIDMRKRYNRLIREAGV